LGIPLPPYWYGNQKQGYVVLKVVKGILGSKTIILVKVVLNMRKTMMYATLSKLYSMKRYILF